MSEHKYPSYLGTESIPAGRDDPMNTEIAWRPTPQYLQRSRLRSVCRARLARFLANIGKRYDTAHATLEPVALNGELGIVISLHGQREAAISFEVEDGLVREVHIIAADDKLAALDRPVDMV